MPFDLGAVTPLDAVPKTNDFMPDGQPFENPLAAAEPTYENAPVSTGTAIGALAQQGVTAQLVRKAERTEVPISPLIQPPADPAFAQSEAKEAAEADQQAAEELPKIVEQQKADAVKRDGILNRWANQTGVAGRVGTSVVAGLLDPLNDAAMFMPGIGEEAVLANIGRMGLSTETTLARMAARGISGASAGVAGMAPITALQYGLAQGEGVDYSIRDAMNDLMFGAIVGAAGHAGFGALREAGLMRPDALMRERLAIPLEQGVVPAAIPADVNADAMHAAASQVMSGREVDVDPIFNVHASMLAEQELRSWVASRSAIDAETSGVLQNADKLSNAAGVVQARAEAARASLESLRAEHAGVLSDTEEAVSRLSRLSALTAEDVVTPQRLQAIDAELQRPGINAARRADLEAERDLLAKGSGPIPVLDAARTGSEVTALQKRSVAIQQKVTSLQAKLDAETEKSSSLSRSASQKLALQSERLRSREEVTQALAVRTFKRYAAYSGIDISAEEAEAFARRAMGGEDIKSVLASVGKPNGRAIAPSPDPAGITKPVNGRDVALQVAQQQQAIYKNGYALGIPQREFDATHAAVYGPEAEPTPGEAKPPAAGTAKAATEGDKALAEWQAKFDAAGVVLTPEDQAALDAAKANLDRANASSEGYAQAGECLTGAGI